MLSIPRDQGLWCAGVHEPPLRVSGVQSALHPGQLPFREELVVREAVAPHRGWTPHHGRVEIRARMELSARSMASLWLAGLEERPEESGEICVFEIFGDALEAGAAAVGTGIKPFRDPALTWEFDAPRVAIDARELHVYAAEWRPGRVDFLVDGDHLKTVDQAPGYPLQAMIAVFDFPEKDGPEDHVPVLGVDYVRGEPL